MFNADDVVASTELPQLQFKNQMYTGRILSIEEYSKYAARFKELAPDASEAEALAQYEQIAPDFLRDVFPECPDVIAELLKNKAQTVAATVHFFQLVTAEMNEVVRAVAKAVTSGTSSATKP